jgi:hypothetical protein
MAEAQYRMSHVLLPVKRGEMQHEAAVHAIGLPNPLADAEIGIRSGKGGVNGTTSVGGQLAQASEPGFGARGPGGSDGGLDDPDGRGLSFFAGSDSRRPPNPLVESWCGTPGQQSRIEQESRNESGPGSLILKPLGRRDGDVRIL